MRYFIVSDIHSHCTELKKALKKAGFNKRNKNHTLIVCGDVFDRGYETINVYKYLSSIPKKRCILIKGNHEELFFDLINKEFPQKHDFSNGTVRAFCEIAGIDEKKLNVNYVYHDLFMVDTNIDYYTVKRQVDIVWECVKQKVKESAIYRWLQSNQWVDYYEVDKYIFVHSFIPVNNPTPYGLYGIGFQLAEPCLSYNYHWRSCPAASNEWSEARWGCPYKQYDAGLFDEEKKNGKILVCGHWHAADFNKHYNNEDENYNAYLGSNLIAIDGCTAYTKKVNVLIIDENLNHYAI